MIKHEPFTGYGVGGFSAHYMDYQAQYFKEHPDSQFAILADNIKSPFNEYLSVGVQFGILTWVLLIAAGIFLILCHRKHPTKAGYVSLLSLLSIAVFSFFSYPFTYPFIWIISALSVSTLIGKAYENTLFQKTTIIKRGIAFFLLIGSLFLLIEVVSRIKAELEWGKVAHMSLCGRTNDMLPRYHNLLHTFRRNPYFLYNYSAELCVAEKYKECLAITAICCNYWSDYNLELVQAEAYIGLKQYDAAKHHLEKATLMCPVRFIPLYRLHYVYMKQGKAEKANMLISRKDRQSKKLPICFLQAGYGILQFFNILSSHSITYNVVGSFDNPAGFAGSLCAGLPFTFYFLQYSNKKVQWASWCALFVIVLGVLLSESRAGSISIFTVLVIYFIHQNKIKFHYKKHIGSFLLCLSFLLISIFVISVTVYHLKKIRQMVDY